MTLRMQCWLFAVGSALFAVGAAPAVAQVGAATATNVLCFAGSWFFTSAAFIQMQRSTDGPDRWSAEAQFVGTVLFNISTGAAVWAHRIPTERHLVWTPDVCGSTLFLVSSVIAVWVVGGAVGWLRPTAQDWQVGWLNLVGSVAFGVSAVGAFVSRSGATADPRLANLGTFIGAVCFLAAALLALPQRQGERP